MAPSQNGPGQEGIKFNQCAGLIFHETGKAEGDGGQQGQGTPSTIAKPSCCGLLNLEDLRITVGIIGQSR